MALGELLPTKVMKEDVVPRYDLEHEVEDPLAMSDRSEINAPSLVA